MSEFCDAPGADAPRHGRRYLERSSVVVTEPTNTPYRAMMHAVAVNGFYESSPEVITTVVRAALRSAAERGARTVALTALATGYGRLTLSQFGQGLAELVGEAFPPIEDLVIVVRRREDVQDVSQAAPGVEPA